MDQRRADRRLSDRGVSSVQFLLASALSVLLFVAFANVVAVQYGRGAIRSALEQGVRAGSISSSPADCEATAREVTRQLLGGRMSDGLVLNCALDGEVIRASATAVFEAWSPLTPDFPISMVAESAREPLR